MLIQNAELSIRITGEAGQGLQTIGSALQQIFKNCGFNVFSSQDNMSRIRGGNNSFQIRLAARPLHSPRGQADLIVALDKNSVPLHRDQLFPQGILILDQAKYKITENNPLFFDVPLYRLAQESGGSDLYISAVACGIIGGITQLNINYLTAVIGSTFAKKEPSIVEKNLKALSAGYNFARDNFKSDRFKLEPQSGQHNAPQILLNGNEAIALGAVKAGCKFYSGYPMSPSTSLMENLAKYLPKYNGVVEQAEDEIGAVNMVIGAAFAGVRAMTGTSGGGFCLMVEGLSLAGMTETPLVLVDAQRPGPATGFPTRTEQADLDFIIQAGHGEFARVVYAPGTPEEAFYLTLRAFDLAEKYQIPVIILTDQHLSESVKNIEKSSLSAENPIRYIISKIDSQKITNYKRYQLTETGISPRGIPSWLSDPIYVDSDEHTAEGHITESGELRNKMVEKRFYKKFSGLEKEIVAPVTYQVEKAQTILLGFGSNYGILKEVVDLAPPGKLGMIHLPQVWPFPVKVLINILKNKKVFTLENNAGAQLAKLLRRESGLVVDGSFLKFDGRPFDLDYVQKILKEANLL